MSQSVMNCFDEAAAHYDQYATLQRQIGDRLLTKAKPANHWLDLGAGTGYIGQRLPAVQLISVDLAPAMLALNHAPGHKVCADIRALPFANQSADGLAANLSLQWCLPLKATLTELKRIAKSDSQLLFSVPLQGCFPELEPLNEQLSLQSDSYFKSVELMQVMQATRWRQVEIEPITIICYFDSPRDLLRHFKGTGAHHANNRPVGLKGRRWWQHVSQHLESQRTAQGIPLTWQLALVQARG